MPVLLARGKRRFITTFEILEGFLLKETFARKVPFFSGTITAVRSP